MGLTSFVPLALGLVMFSFALTAVLIIPFIDLLFKLKAVRPKEAPKTGKVPLFDTFHDQKAGTPLGGGILIVVVVAAIFYLIFPFASHMGVFIRSSFDFKNEVAVIMLTFLAFGLLGGLDDYIKIFGKPTSGKLGLVVGMGRRNKFILQWVIALAISFLMYRNLGIEFIHLPFFEKNLHLGLGYIPFAAFIIVSFANAFNITDGLDGLATGLLLICLLAFGVIAVGNLDTPLLVFIAVWIGALLAFLYFNVWPARIFLGDVGALAFGATLGVIGLLTGSIFALVIIGGIFIVELASSAVQIYGWKKFKRPILPLAPLHNTFRVIGWEEPKIVVRAWLAGIMLAIFGLWLATI
ncbi:hypothetical protein A2188_01245 [Candidatus Woesebacteria bacterium RIFOXYA1_FULL_43_9]|uniref:Phospho-N-acetylmuramoyl-pentapeptide-transferase n=1 Tax=Candidatus Woesebacteria bacterium RIFOXYA1_FULL_43_9 TaxID=1802534 RepID=A0A1F8CP01_9BACT|nr:MAG: hypothetical protein A2188_01245 [Candidatus Woesebacteria bacterium RIFOXYA1_FULL_43_9]